MTQKTLIKLFRLQSLSKIETANDTTILHT